MTNIRLQTMKQIDWVCSFVPRLRLRSYVNTGLWIESTEEVYTTWECSDLSLNSVSFVFKLTMATPELRTELVKYLESLNIQTVCVDHPPVFTVEEMMPHLQDLSGAVTKNLFLKDKKKGLWLVSVRHDRPVNLNDLAKKLGLGSGNLRFADEAAMLEKLKVGQGCATALALFCDKDQSVKFVLDSDLVNGGHERVYFHPMTNAVSMGLKPEDLMKFLKETGHEPVLQSFD